LGDRKLIEDNAKVIKDRVLKTRQRVFGCMNIGNTLIIRVTVFSNETSSPWKILIWEEEVMSE